MADAVKEGKDEDHGTQNELDTWNNRARVFIHEATHYNYFIDADGTVPYVDDLSYEYKQGTDTIKSEGYGPKDVRILANYKKMGKGGFYTQRNGQSAYIPLVLRVSLLILPTADTYAWFAIAKYIQKQIGLYVYRSFFYLHESSTDAASQLSNRTGSRKQTS